MPFLAFFILMLFITGGDLLMSIIFGIVLGFLAGLVWLLARVILGGASGEHMR
jgi:hypothetical protein